VIVIIAAVFALTACDGVKTSESTKAVKFVVVTQNGQKTVNVIGTAKETYKDINAIVYQEKSSKVEYKINGDLDISLIDDEENIDEYYLSLDPYRELGEEYKDYVELTYAYEKYHSESPIISDLSGSSFYDKFLKWADFVSDKVLYLKRVTYVGKIKICNSSDNVTAEQIKEVYKTCSWIYPESSTNGTQLIESLNVIKEDIKNNPSLKDDYIKEFESMRGNSLLDPVINGILYNFDAFLADSETVILPTLRYTTLPIKTVPKHAFIGCFDEANGNGIQYIDENGSWLVFPSSDLTLYSYYIAKPIKVCMENDKGEITNLGEVVDGLMPELPQVDGILGWYIVGTNIKITDANGIYRSGYELISNDDYQTAIVENDEECVLKLEYKNE